MERLFAPGLHTTTTKGTSKMTRLLIAATLAILAVPALAKSTVQRDAPTTNSMIPEAI